MWNIIVGEKNINKTRSTLTAAIIKARLVYVSMMTNSKNMGMYIYTCIYVR